MNQTDNAIKYLASCFLFEGIPPTAAERCLRNCELSVRDYRSGDIICSPAEGVGGLKTVLSGRAVVTGVGGSDAVLRTIEPGGIFGAAELFRPEGESYISVIRAKCATRVLTGRRAAYHWKYRYRLKLYPVSIRTGTLSRREDRSIYGRKHRAPTRMRAA